MINQLTIIALIPARGGSKGLPRKNIKSLAGKPLIEWTIEAAKQSRFIDRVIVSTDDEEIQQISLMAGAEVPFLRPAHLAKDETPGIAPVVHAIEQLPEADIIVMLQPTSPLRTVEQIDEAISEFVNQRAQLLVSVTPSTKPPHWQYELSPENRLLMNEAPMLLRRQDAPRYYSLNGAIYIATVEKIVETEKFLTSETVAYLMDKESSFDIDDELDFYVCEQLMLQKQLKK